MPKTKRASYQKRKKMVQESVKKSRAKCTPENETDASDITVAHAEKLHVQQPDHYADDNHKPEMALALTPFTGMNGFKRLSKILYILEAVPEFRAVIGEEGYRALNEAGVTDPKGTSVEAKAALKKTFTAFMHQSDDLIRQELEKLEKRFKKLVSEGEDILSVGGDVFLQLCKEFRGDIGCFSSFFFNTLTLQPGEAMFLEANEPHAYLFGDCIECMACSDNVVRAGCTPKFKDVPTLCEMLTYITTEPEERIFNAVVDQSDPFVTIYNPPVPDFAVDKIEFGADVNDYTISSYDSASIVIFIRGSAQAYASSIDEPISIKRGSVIFVAAGESVQLKPSSQEGLLAFRAYCPLE